jgi:hypothetical protein
MALTDSNTYIEPTAGTALNSARGQINNSLRSILTNFKSSSAPIAVNLSASGANIGVQDGMLYRNDTNKALYIADSTNVKSAPVGGNFTRIGLGNRVENGITALTANAATYEIGELVATVSATPSLASNSRLYLNIANNSNMSDFIDIGIPPALSVVNTMIAINGVTSDRITFRNFVTNGNSGANAHLKVTTTVGNNTAIALGTSNTSSNVSLVKFDGSQGQGINSGINIMDQTGVNYAPLSANIISQATIQGTNTSVSPLVPAGSITIWPGASAPAGWIFADGTIISRTTYAALFAICGTTYGAGNGSTTFTLPDFSDKTAVGVGSNIARGAKAGALPSGGAITTGSVSTGVNLSFGTASTGVKDAGGLAVATSINDPGHTHGLVLPFLGIHYIIKT